MEYEVRNSSANTAQVQLGGWLHNTSAWFRGESHLGSHRNRIKTNPHSINLICDSVGKDTNRSDREDILFEDFEDSSYDNWTVQGDAFGDIPFPRSEFPDYHNLQGHVSLALANSHNARISGPNSQSADQLTGKLTSKEFRINRKYLNFLISGGNHQGQTELQLIVDGQVVSRQQGDNSNTMKARSIDTSKYEGKKARIVIVDSATGAWGHIGVDFIVMSDSPPTGEALDQLPDYGSMVLSLLKPGNNAAATALTQNPMSDIWDAGNFIPQADVPIKQKLVGGLQDSFNLEPGQSKTVVFTISWHFPNIHKGYSTLQPLTNIQQQRNFYSERFDNAMEVAEYVAENYIGLSSRTKL